MINIYVVPSETRMSRIRNESISYFISDHLPFKYVSIGREKRFILDEESSPINLREKLIRVNPYNFLLSPSNFVQGQENVISIRSITEIEEHLFHNLYEGKKVKVDDMNCAINRISYKPELRDAHDKEMFFYSRTPILCRVEDDGEYDAMELKIHGIEQRNRYFYLTINQHRLLLAKHLKKKLINKANKIYGRKYVEHQDDFHIELADGYGDDSYSPVIRFNKNSISYASSICSRIRIDGSPFWVNLAFTLGLGDFTRFGYGLLIKCDN